MVQGSTLVWWISAKDLGFTRPSLDLWSANGLTQSLNNESERSLTLPRGSSLGAPRKEINLSQRCAHFPQHLPGSRWRMIVSAGTEERGEPRITQKGCKSFCLVIMPQTCNMLWIFNLC